MRSKPPAAGLNGEDKRLLSWSWGALLYIMLGGRQMWVTLKEFTLVTDPGAGKDETGSNSRCTVCEEEIFSTLIGGRQQS